MRTEPTYAEVGATRHEPLPAGYRHVRRDVPIGHGRPAFERAAEALLTWRMHRDAGLGVRTAATRAAPGAVVVLRLLILTAPCRVIYTIGEDDRRGFAYGTLPGHPERGEEAFLLHLTGAGEVRFRIRAFSRPASLAARCGGPLTRAVQDRVTGRYVAALARVSGDDQSREAS